MLCGTEEAEEDSEAVFLKPCRAFSHAAGRAEFSRCTVSYTRIGYDLFSSSDLYILSSLAFIWQQNEFRSA